MVEWEVFDGERTVYGEHLWYIHRTLAVMSHFRYLILTRDNHTFVDSGEKYGLRLGIQFSALRLRD